MRLLRIELLKLRILMFIAGQLLLLVPARRQVPANVGYYEQLGEDVAQEIEQADG